MLASALVTAGMLLLIVLGGTLGDAISRHAQLGVYQLAVESGGFESPVGLWFTVSPEQAATNNPSATAPTMVT